MVREGRPGGADRKVDLSHHAFKSESPSASDSLDMSLDMSTIRMLQLGCPPHPDWSTFMMSLGWL